MESLIPTGDGRAQRLPDNQRLAIESLVTGHRRTEVARHAGVSERTLRRWLQDPGFVQALDLARTSCWVEVESRVQDSGHRAVDALLRNLESERPHAQIAAARLLLQLGQKVVDRSHLRAEQIERHLCDLDAEEVGKAAPPAAEATEEETSPPAPPEEEPPDLPPTGEDPAPLQPYVSAPNLAVAGFGAIAAAVKSWGARLLNRGGRKRRETKSGQNRPKADMYPRFQPAAAVALSTFLTLLAPSAPLGLIRIDGVFPSRASKPHLDDASPNDS